MTACRVNISNSREFLFSYLWSDQTHHIYVHIYQENKPFFKKFCLYDFLTAKSLVARLMEVDQDQRLTAQEAINHEW